MRGCQLGLVSETWEKEKCPITASRLEELFYLDNIECFSSPRPKGRVGGGVSILINHTKYSGSRLEVSNPHELEVVWVVVRPRSARWMEDRIIIACAFYCPPRSKKCNKLIDHLTTTTNHLLTRFEGAAIMIGGDRNNMGLGPLLNGLPGFSGSCPNSWA